MTEPITNWFISGGTEYARFRPRYPERLVARIIELAPRRTLAVDVGCGNGQLTTLLAGDFDAVVGVDPSADQIAHAAVHERVRYLQAPAERLPLPDGCADLVTVAQAVHWFDLPRFYAEARRVAAPGAVLALLTYGMAHLPGPLDERMQRFGLQELAAYWPPQIQLIVQEYRTLDFPFAELQVEPVNIERQLTLDELLGYVSTFSAVRAAAAAGRTGLLAGFAADLAQQWGDPGTRHTMVLPVHLRVGLLHGEPGAPQSGATL